MQEFPKRPEPIEPDQEVVDLPTLLANEFGISRNIATQQVLMGMVTIDGVEWRPRLDQPLLIPQEDLVGREIMVRGRDRSFRMTYGR